MQQGTAPPPEPDMPADLCARVQGRLLLGTSADEVAEMKAAGRMDELKALTKAACWSSLHVFNVRTSTREYNGEVRR